MDSEEGEGYCRSGAVAVSGICCKGRSDICAPARGARCQLCTVEAPGRCGRVTVQPEPAEGALCGGMDGMACRCYLGGAWAAKHYIETSPAV